MGVWGNGRFDNDDALDFIEELNARGWNALRNALGKKTLNGISRASREVSESDIDRLVAIQLVKHDNYLAQGLSVGSREEAEVTWRETFELSAAERRVWEIFGFMAALAVLESFLDDNKPLPEEVVSWVQKNAKSASKKLPDLVALASSTWAACKEQSILINETLAENQLEHWYEEVSATVESLVALSRRI